MAGKNWHISDDIRLLTKNPGCWNFFQGVRRIECANLGKPRIGESNKPDDDPARFGQLVTLAFTPNDIGYYGNKRRNDFSEFLVNCFGILGSNGAMPLFFTEYIYQRCKHHNDYALMKFIDLFQHRMISFLYRAWAIFNPAVSCDREDNDYFLNILKSLTGCSYKVSKESSESIEEYVQAYYSGFIAKYTHGRGALAAILFDYFKVPVQIIEFSGFWKRIADKYLCFIGENPENSTIGGGMALGEKYWDCKKKFRVKLGPMPYQKYVEFLPGRPAFKHLVEWVKKFNLSHFEWDLQLVLDAGDVKGCSEGTLVGYTGWILSEKNAYDRKDLIIENPEKKYRTEDS